MLTFILVFMSALVVALLIYAATKPNSFKVTREILIHAPRTKVFPYLNNFHLWQEWTPYNKDPHMNKTFSGPDEGVGAKLAWQGNKKVGKGEITITQAVSPEKVVFDLHMLEPFPGRNHVEIYLTEIENQTRVIWQLTDQHTYFLKILSTVLNLDKVIGSDFEVGLAKLKRVTESEHKEML